MSGKIMRLNEAAIKSGLWELMRSSAGKTLNGLPEQEAQALTNAGRYERTENRPGCRSGHYKRRPLTGSGEVTPKMPKLEGVTLETAINERRRRREGSVEEAPIGMCLAGTCLKQNRGGAQRRSFHP